MTKKILIAITILISTTYIYGQAPKYSNEFLALGVGARALGMSNSVVAITDDATSGYWNPAGLTLLKSDRQIALMHSEYFAGIAKYDFASIAARIDETSTAGLTFIRFGVDDIPDTSELIDSEGNINYDRIKSFSAADYAILLSYARKTKIEGLRYGANIKVVRRVVGSFANSWGFGLDLGAQYDVGKWKFGAVGKDLTSTFNAWSYTLNDQIKEVFTLTGNEIPENTLEITMPKIILGAARQFDISKKFSLITELDLDVTTDGMRNVVIKRDPISIDPHFGLELGYNNLIFLRGGVGNVQEEKDISGVTKTTFQPNFGIGINIKNIITIDYALTDIGDNSIALYSNVFSLKFNISKRDNAPMQNN
ncbi:MAG: PorV/PorQ family protein [Saprospiraceae bacterium]|nr:PorV/PorQ family protein [Saprospiraceae bacterium]